MMKLLKKNIELYKKYETIMRFYKNKYDDTKLCQVNAISENPPSVCNALEYEKGFAGIYHYIESHDELFAFLSSYEEVEKNEFLKIKTELIKSAMNRYK